MSRLRVGLAAIALLVGCKSKSEGSDQAAELKKQLAPIVDKHRPIVGPIVAALEKTDAVALAAPRVTQREPLSSKLTAPEGTPSQEALESGGIFIASPGWLSTPSDTYKMAVWPKTLPVSQLVSLVNKGTWGDIYGNPAAIDRDLASLANVRHVVYMRVFEETLPEAQQASSTFTPGDARGDVLVFSLPDGARIGAFPLEAKVDVDEITVDRATSNERLASVFEGAVLRETIRGLFAP